MKRSAFFLLLFSLAAVIVAAQSIPTGPRTAQGNPVNLTPVPLHATPAEIQALLARNRNVYFRPGTYNIGTLQLNNWKGGVIWGAGRLTTTLRGSIRISGKSNLTLGNLSITGDPSAKEEAILDATGNSNCNITLLNILVSGSKEVTAVRLRAPGQYMLQGCNLKWSDIGLSIEHPKAIANVFGGNLQYNRIHIQQRKGHLDARAFGMQGNKGSADIVVHAPSPLGYHLIEGIRTEGNNGMAAKEMLLSVPQTSAAVNVALRANTLGSMTLYADYNAQGTLLLLENVNYPGAEDKSSVGVMAIGSGKATVISYGNKYGLSYDAAPGPFVVSSSTKVESMGDLWMLPNTTDYTKPFNEPITAKSMQAAGKAVPQNISFVTAGDLALRKLPNFSHYKGATLPRITNLGALMLNVKDFGALPNDGQDDRAAIQRALDAAEKGGVYEPLYFPAGVYELSAPLFLDHLAGGGFWGDGAEKSVLLSTSGKGVLTSDGAGYASFADIGFVNKPGAETTTTVFDWINPQSPDKKRGNTGAALQANMFYRCRFENGSTGMAVGRNRMGDGFMMVDCIFRNQRTAKGEGAAYSSDNFNVLTNPLVHCLFENVDCAVLNTKGSFNFYGNKLTDIRTAALKFYAVVGDGFAIVNNDMDASPVPLVVTGHSSAKAHLLIDAVRVKAPASIMPASVYNLGGSVMFLRSLLPNRTILNGGSIGDNSLIIYDTQAAGITTTGRAHRYLAGGVEGEKKVAKGK